MKSSGRRLNFGFDRFSGLYLGLLFLVVFSILSPGLFLSVNTFFSVGSQQAVVAMLAIALLFPLAAGVFDLSIGANVGLCAVLAAQLQVVVGLGMLPTIAIILSVGIVIGLVNGFVVVKLGVSSFIATLAMASILAAVISIVTNNVQPLPATGGIWTGITQTKFLGFQMIFWYLIILAFVAWWLLEKTPTGRYIYAVGGNTEAARLSGVPVGRYTWLSFVLCSGITAVTGILYSSLNGPSLTFGTALLLPAFAAAFLGLTQIRPGRFNVWGTMVAVYVLAIGVRGLTYLTSAQWLNAMFNGVALIAAVSFAVWRQRAQNRASASDFSEPDSAHDTTKADDGITAVAAGEDTS